MVIETVAGVAAIEPGLQLVLSLGSLVTMVTVLTACVCCKKPMKHRGEDLEEAYGVIPADDPTSPRVNFRFGNGHAPSERHSQPASKTPSSAALFGPRTSAPIHQHPPRALPPIPTEEPDGASALYAQIDKRGKCAPRDDIEYADGGGGGEGPAGTYDSIDYDDDIDQLYSRVGPQAARRYDYPQFKRATPPTAAVAGAGDARKPAQRPPADPTYQSASQIYGPTASEDPYSSIASGPRAGASANGGGGDSSSAYDPGYARVRPEGRAARGSDDVEGELDHLYSKIRRSASGERAWDGAEERSDAGEPTTASMFGLPGSRVGSTMGGDRNVPPPSRPPAADDAGGNSNSNSNNNTDDDQSMSSRDPSYRYITVRQTAESIRARLEREQRIAGAPSSGGVREHYYSTIGSDRLYESVDEPPSRQIGAQLAVDTTVSSAHQNPPLPPTSPIPDRNALRLSPGKAAPGASTSPSQLYSAINKPPGGGAATGKSAPGNGSAPARTGDNTPARNATISTAPSKSPFGNPRHATIVKPEDDGFADGPKVVRRPPIPQQQRTPSEERSTTVADGPARKEAEERSTVARCDMDLRRREQSPGRLKRDSSQDRSTQTVQRPTVVQDSGQALRDRRASPITVVSPGIPLMNGSLPPSMSSSINNPGIDGSSVASRSIVDPMTSSAVTSEFPEEKMTRSVTTTETTCTDVDGVVRRRVVEERETVHERRSGCSSRSSSVHFAASEDEMEEERGGAHSARAPARTRTRHDSGGSQSARYASHSSLEQQQRFHVGGAPGPEFTHGGDRIYRVPIHLTDSTQSLEAAAGGETRSARASSRSSALPRRQSSEELRAAHARSRERREAASPAASRTPRAASRARREEEEARRKESTIYTGRDYVSPIDLTTERAWPLVGQSSPPSLRHEMATSDADLTPRAPLQPTSGRTAAATLANLAGHIGDRVNNNVAAAPRKQPPPPITNGLAGILRTDL